LDWIWKLTLWTLVNILEQKLKKWIYKNWIPKTLFRIWRLHGLYLANRTIRRRGITQKKLYYIYNTAKTQTWNQEQSDLHIIINIYWLF
jgi:hypothetical protein